MLAPKSFLNNFVNKNIQKSASKKGNTNLRPATPIAKRLRQRPKLEPIVLPEPINQPNHTNKAEKSTLLTLAENLRFKLAPNTKRLPAQEGRKDINMQDETNNKNNVPNFQTVSEELTKESMSVEHNPKLKLLFEDDTEIDEIHKSEEVQPFQSKEASAEDSTSPNKRKLQALEETRINASEADTHSAKKRKACSVDSFEEIPYSKPERKNLSGETFAVCLLYFHDFTFDTEC